MLSIMTEKPHDLNGFEQPRLVGLLKDAIWDFEPGVLHHVWRAAVQQAVDQELNMRKQRIAAEESMRKGTKDESADEGDADGDQVTEESVQADRRSTLKYSDMAETAEKKGKNEKIWRAAFGRLSSNFRCRQGDMVKVLELSGIRDPNQQWADEVFGRITKMNQVTVDEYIKFVYAYLDRQQLEYSNIFRSFDADNSGTIDIPELETVLAAFGMEPLPHVLKEVINDVDSDGSGLLSLNEFFNLLECLYECEGFSRQERIHLSDLFKRFDSNGNGYIPTEGLHGLLGWLGYHLAAEEARDIAGQVDVDGSGNIDFQEVLVCMRKVRDMEIKSLKAAIVEFDQDKSGSLSSEELEPLLMSLGYIPDRAAVIEAATDAGVNLNEMRLNDLWQFLQVYRQREGLSRDECAEVEAAFERYDPEQKGEISTVDLGKALRWFGYQVSFTVQQSLIEEVDIDRSGKLDQQELRKLIRMYWEKELKRMQSAFNNQCKDSKSKVLTLAQAEKAFRRIDFVDSQQKTPVIENPDPDGIDSSMFISVGIGYKKQLRAWYRQNGGYTPAEVEKMKLLFNQYDEDRSDSIATNELGALIRQIFPVMNQSIRAKLDLLMKEIDADGPGIGQLCFEDFLRTMRQFHDIQNQERIDKEVKAVASTGFSPTEVQGFRDLYMSCDSNGDNQMHLPEVKNMLQNVCPLGDKNAAELAAMFRQVRDEVDQQQGTKLEGSSDAVDFPEFMLLMRKLLDANFANIQERLCPQS